MTLKGKAREAPKQAILVAGMQGFLSAEETQEVLDLIDAIPERGHGKNCACHPNGPVEDAYILMSEAARQAHSRTMSQCSHSHPYHDPDCAAPEPALPASEALREAHEAVAEAV